MPRGHNYHKLDFVPTGCATRLRQETIVDESALQGLPARDGSRFWREAASSEQTSIRCSNSTTISIPSPTEHSFASSFAFANACVHKIFVVIYFVDATVCKIERYCATLGIESKQGLAVWNGSVPFRSCLHDEERGLSCELHSSRLGDGVIPNRLWP